MSLSLALVMLFGILAIAAGTLTSSSTRVKSWGVWAILVVASIPSAGVIVLSVLEALGL